MTAAAASAAAAAGAAGDAAGVAESKKASSAGALTDRLTAPCTTGRAGPGREGPATNAGVRKGDGRNGAGLIRAEKSIKFQRRRRTDERTNVLQSEPAARTHAVSTSTRRPTGRGIRETSDAGGQRACAGGTSRPCVACPRTAVPCPLRGRGPSGSPGGGHSRPLPSSRR